MRHVDGIFNTAQLKSCTHSLNDSRGKSLLEPVRSLPSDIESLFPGRRQTHRVEGDRIYWYSRVPMDSSCAF
jgi:hypothetical protein